MTPVPSRFFLLGAEKAGRGSGVGSVTTIGDAHPTRSEPLSNPFAGHPRLWSPNEADRKCIVQLVRGAAGAASPGLGREPAVGSEVCVMTQGARRMNEIWMIR